MQLRTKGRFGHLPVSDAERFWRWVKVGSDSECWEWQGNRSRIGYGSFRYEGCRQQAHRVAWQLKIGVIPDGLWVLHRCDNPPCCNPAHLFLGDNLINTQDKERKDRGHHPRGSAHCRAVITEATALRIMVAIMHGDQDKEIATAHSVSRDIVTDIRRYHTWSHLWPLIPRTEILPEGK
jgi:hypothetical protein